MTSDKLPRDGMPARRQIAAMENLASRSLKASYKLRKASDAVADVAKTPAAKMARWAAALAAELIWSGNDLLSA